jgi:hypothetical protein
MGTEFIEHFFGLARSLMPNFTYAEFLKMIKHIMFRQRMLLSGKFSSKKERTSRVGYILDYDPSPLTEAELLRRRVTLTTEDVHQLVDLGYREAVQICKDLLHMPVPQLPLILSPLSGVNSKTKTPQQLAKTNVDDEDSDAEIEEEEDTDDEDAELDTEHDNMDADATAEAAALDTSRYAGLCADFDATIAEARPQNSVESTSSSSPVFADIATTAPPPSNLVLTSKILDKHGALSIRLMLNMRELHQSGTGTRSQRTIKLDPKFTKRNKLVEADDAEKKMRLSIQEASHRVRVVQALDISATRTKSTREIRWQTAAKELERLAPNGTLSFTYRVCYKCSCQHSAT